MSVPKPLGTVITFYSYKGGVGRTLALANVAALLATWGRRVLCIDWDLEAPGLHQYFKEHVSGEVLRTEPGLVELVEAWSRGEETDWRAHVRRLDLPRASEPLSLLPAGRLDDTYVARMQQLDWGALYERQQFGSTLERWRDEWKQAYDFILVDSRTGVTDIGGICTIQLPDQLVLCVTANEQSLQGAKDIAERAATQRQRLPFDRGGVPCVPVPTRFEGRVESALAKQWLERFATELEPLYRQWIAATITPRALLNLLKVPAVPVWTFGEALPVLTEGTADPESIGFAFETLAALLDHKLADTSILLDHRDRFINAAAWRYIEAKIPDAYLIYNPLDLKLADRIALALVNHGVSVRLVDLYHYKDYGGTIAQTPAHVLLFGARRSDRADMSMVLLSDTRALRADPSTRRRTVLIGAVPTAIAEPFSQAGVRVIALPSSSEDEDAALADLAEFIRATRAAIPADTPSQGAPAPPSRG